MPENKQAIVTQTIDTGDKDGKVTCTKCGWNKPLGGVFHQYEIASCPVCDPEITTRTQTSLVTGKKPRYLVEHGSFIYFVLTNGLHILFSKRVTHSEVKRRLPR